MTNTLNPVLERSASSPYSAKRMARPVNFYCSANRDAKSVYLLGDFNDWDPSSLPMERQLDGWWFVQVPLTHGHHQYLFLVDGKPAFDPHATETVRVELFGKVSVIAVS
ncbi:MAG TPA: isoamylase early set domain-containing protein [Verrucomicrobiae bacterium]|nr:isoamylase early set domain-containing protein [Verrucomicrobiae bacterium]